MQSEIQPKLNVTHMVPPWPGPSYPLACPIGTTAVHCNALSSIEGALKFGCTEPELDTVEVLNSFLLGRKGSLYVDIGCNIGYHAAHAAALGARVDCYEPTPVYVQAIEQSRRLSNASHRWDVHNVAVVPDGRMVNKKFLRLHAAYTPCGIGLASTRARRFWDVPTMPIRDIVKGKRVTLLKIDIDSVEGKLLHTVERAIARGETFVETILVELGDNDSADAWCLARGGDGDELDDQSYNGKERNASIRCNPLPRAEQLRGGSVQDVWRLQHEHGYDVYRVNVHTGREVFDWRGQNVNSRMAKVPQGLHPMFFVRNMRKLEWLDPRLPLNDFAPLFRFGQSYLLTRVRMATLTKHHWYDLINMEHGARAVRERRMVHRPNESEHARLVRGLNMGSPLAAPGARYR